MKGKPKYTIQSKHPSKRKSRHVKCIACEGSGVATKGYKCHPCNGAGYLRK